jgi:LemA protein
MPNAATARNSAALLVLVAMLISGCGINDIPTEEEQAKSAWSEVQNQYQRRADLIPNLVNTVRGFATQEREVLTEVTLAVSERYPDLKSNQNFLALQSQLEGTENRIAVARRDYIQAVQTYNTEVRTFPGRFWAMVYSATPMATFTTTEENQRPPTVQF